MGTPERNEFYGLSVGPGLESRPEEIEMRRFLLGLITLQCALAVVGASQEKRTVYAGCGKYPFLMFSDTGDFAHSEDPITNHYLAGLELTRESVLLSDEALRTALRDSRVEIRYSAAWYLADQDAKAAIPDIVEALEAEKCRSSRTTCAARNVNAI
jgi:hypothetical protein